MARNRRRPPRSAAQKSPQVTPSSSRSATPELGEQPDPAPHSEEDSCPACGDDTTQVLNQLDKENWIRCDACKTWYHWRCAGNGDDVETIDKWFCKSCLAADPTRVVTTKAPARKSSRKRTQRDYASLNSGMLSDPNRWTRMLEGKSIKSDSFKRMAGADVGLEWLQSDDTAMREPIIIENQEGLGMKMPPKDFNVDDVAELLGESTPVEVIDVASQSLSPGWTLGKWAEYFGLEPAARDKIWNVISLEVSGTKLADKILPPRLVRELDWVEKYWPSTRKGKGHAYPKVQLYCLMGVAKAWTDWHVDFAGSSVYYHILHGSKVFYFIRPTPANLALYERWSGTELQNHAWLGDMVDEVIKVELVEGNTMIIPSGWIHAVYTPTDTLVFGGNFLHSYDVATQLKIRNIEIATQVPKKFRFPMFSKLCWYVGDKYLRDLKGKEEFSERVLDSIDALAGFLVSEARTIERGTDHAKREAKEQVPSDRIKDPSAMARELRWRVRLATGAPSDDERSNHRKSKDVVNGHGANKRKREGSSGPDEVRAVEKFKNFKPKIWESMGEQLSESEKRRLATKKPGSEEEWTALCGKWAEAEDAVGRDETDAVDMVDVERRRDVVVRVRRTAKGFERQRVERVVEEWIWPE